MRETTKSRITHHGLGVAMPETKPEVLADYRAAYSEFRTAIEGLTEEQMEKPFLDSWSVREIVAHVAGWHDQLGSGLERIAQGQRAAPEGVDWNDIQGWNDRFAGMAANQRPVDLIQRLDDQTRRFIAALEALPDERYGEGKTTNRMADAAGAHHFREHANDIQQARSAGTI
jgi:uncharacterized protein (TIGR03083 family)